MINSIKDISNPILKEMDSELMDLKKSLDITK